MERDALCYWWLLLLNWLYVFAAGCNRCTRSFTAASSYGAPSWLISLWAERWQNYNGLQFSVPVQDWHWVRLVISAWRRTTAIRNTQQFWCWVPFLPFAAHFSMASVTVPSLTRWSGPYWKQIRDLACLYVYSDHILSRQVPPPLPARVCFMSGLYSTALSLIWVAVYTLPRFDQLIHVHDEVSNAEVLSMYAFVTVSNALHSWNYYELIERTGNVSKGDKAFPSRVCVVAGYQFAKLATFPGGNRYFARFAGHSGVYLEPCVVLHYRFCTVWV